MKKDGWPKRIAQDLYEIMKLVREWEAYTKQIRNPFFANQLTEVQRDDVKRSLGIIMGQLKKLLLNVDKNFGSAPVLKKFLADWMSTEKGLKELNACQNVPMALGLDEKFFSSTFTGEHGGTRIGRSAPAL